MSEAGALEQLVLVTLSPSYTTDGKVQVDRDSFFVMCQAQLQALGAQDKVWSLPSASLEIDSTP